MVALFFALLLMRLITADHAVLCSFCWGFSFSLSHFPIKAAYRLSASLLLMRQFGEYIVTAVVEQFFPPTADRIKHLLLVRFTTSCSLCLLTIVHSVFSRSDRESRCRRCVFCLQKWIVVVVFMTNEDVKTASTAHQVDLTDVSAHWNGHREWTCVWILWI